jgi:predicted DNA-binding protein with PD1-like motif
MKSKLLNHSASGRTLVLVLDPGEEAFKSISAFAAKENITGAAVTAIGAFERATVGWYDFASRSYRRIPVSEQCEVLSVIGDIAAGDDGTPSLHLHAVLGLSDGSTRGGHLLDGVVHPTLEVIVTETPAHLHRRKIPELGIALIDLSG